MKIQNAKQDIQELLSCFLEAFSRPSFNPILGAKRLGYARGGRNGFGPISFTSYG